MNPVLSRANKNMKKQLRNSMNELRDELHNYDVYKEFYEFMKCSPMMQDIIKENRDLKIKNKMLMKKMKLLVSDPFTTDTYPETSKIIKIKIEPIDNENNVIDLTGSDDAEEIIDDKQNIVYVIEEDEEEDEEDDEEVVEEDEQVVEEDEEEVEDEQVVEEEEEEEDDEEEEEVYEIKIKTKSYYVSNETNSTIYSITDDGDVGDEVGKYIDGKPVFNKN